MKSIAVIGAGNVATFFACSLFQKGQPITTIYNRTIVKAQALASKVQSAAIDELKNIDPSCDLYLICVSDDAILVIVEQLVDVISQSATVAHVSGNCSLDVIQNRFTSGGVIWPIQSISSYIDPNNVPLCISATNKRTEKKMSEFAQLISDNLFVLSDGDRAKLHIAAVIVNNFVNYLNHQAFDYCSENGLPYEALHPLMRQTLEAAIDNGDPMDRQTGPAIRKDLSTIKKHIDMLTEQEDLKRLYKYLTKRISNYSNKK